MIITFDMKLFEKHGILGFVSYHRGYDLANRNSKNAIPTKQILNTETGLIGRPDSFLFTKL
jgi:hypothetical protein